MQQLKTFKIGIQIGFRRYAALTAQVTIPSNTLSDSEKIRKENLLIKSLGAGSSLIHDRNNETRGISGGPRKRRHVQRLNLTSAMVQKVVRLTCIIHLYQKNSKRQVNWIIPVFQKLGLSPSREPSTHRDKTSGLSLRQEPHNEVQCQTVWQEQFSEIVNILLI